MRIVVDAMGTDLAPEPDVAGACMAAHSNDRQIILVGDRHTIEGQIARQNLPQDVHRRIEVVHASEVITMSDKPAVVGRTKTQSSLHVGMNLVKDGAADAFVTAGNTGAVQAIAMLHTLHRIQGVKRPALSAIFPIAGHPVIFLDIGANADSKPEWLVQFAIMGEIYARKALNLPHPRVGLLSNGEEESKGNQAVQQAGELLRDMPLNYVGNIEPRDMLNGVIDVVVTDGFIGNILLKTFEASTRYLANIIRDEIRAQWLSTLGGLLSRSAFQRARRRIDTTEIGGAPLLGVNGVVIIAHGSSNALAISNAVNQAVLAVRGQIVETIHDGIAQVSVSEI